MRKRLSWVDVLNEQTLWTSRTDVINWFINRIGRPVTVMDGALEGFEEALGFMRRQMGNLHFGEPVDLLWLDTQLKTVSLGLLHHQGAQEGSDSQLPRFRARVKGLHDTDLIRALKDSLLIDFAEFVGETLDSERCGVARCEGVYSSSSNPIALASFYPPEVEAAWRSEIPALAERSEDDHDLQRCAKLFVASQKTKFCSDSCRFATVQLTKPRTESTYFDEKQRREGRRQEKHFSQS